MTSGMQHENANRAEDSTAAPPEVEEYDCGCIVRFRLVDYGEAGEELPRKPLMVPDYTPCAMHKGNRDLPPRNARLVALRREHERFLNE
jgi:hypothetical protein